MRYTRVSLFAVVSIVLFIVGLWMKSGASSISNGSGGGGGGGTGNAGASVVTTFSATPTFTCPSSTAGTIVNFSLSTALTANITSATISNCTVGSLLTFVFVQDNTGGRAVNFGLAADSPSVNFINNTETRCLYFVISTTNPIAHLISCATQSAGNSPIQGTYVWSNQIPAPNITPPVGRCASWYDNVSNSPQFLCNGSSTPTLVSETIASGSTAMPVAAIAQNACSASATTVVATGILLSDAIIATFATDPTGVLGYGGGTNGGITVSVWPTTNAVNFKLCNQSTLSVTPGAINVNWRVVR